MNMIAVETPFGFVTASWQHADGMIAVRYGQRQGKARASEQHAVNEFVARDMVRGWIAEDLKVAA